MKTKVLTKYAILFKHSRGWTYLDVCNSAAAAQMYVRDKKTIWNELDWKIVPCQIHLNLSDKIAENFQ